MTSVLEGLQQHWWCQMDDECLDIPLMEVNQLNALGESPLHLAAWKGSVSDVQWLIANGADINQRGDFEMTPLHYAYRGGNPENIQALVDAGADASLRCDRGLLPADGRLLR